MLAVAYARQSDQANNRRVNADDEETLSLGSQLAGCRELATANRDRIVQEFAEQFTGLTDARPRYQEMIRFIKDNIKRYPDPEDLNRVRRVYVYKYHRLGRKADDTVPMIGYFATMGVEIIPVRDKQVGNTPMEKLMLYVIMTFAEIQVMDSIQFATDARRELTSKGKLVCAGPPLYGYRYDKENRVRVTNPDTAPVVLRIFDAAARGDGHETIARQLEAEGILTPRGRNARWNARTIGRIIKDPSYKGEPMIVERYRPTKERYANGKHKIETVEGNAVGPPTPAIVSAELWNRANQTASTRSKPLVRHDHWLNGKVFCACGKSMTRNKKPNRPNIGGAAWMCCGYAKRTGCKNSYVPSTEVEPDAWRRVQKWVYDPAHVIAKLNELENALVDRNWEEEASNVEKTVSRLKGQMADLLDTFSTEAKPAVKEAVRSRIDALADQVESHEKMLAAVREKVADARQAAQHLDGLRDSIRAKVWKGEATEQEKSALAEAIGLRIVVTRADDGTRSVDFQAFAYRNPTLSKPGKGSSKPPVKGRSSVVTSVQTTGRWREAPAPSGRSR